MKTNFFLFVVLFTTSSGLAQTGDYPYTPVKFSDVRIHDAFWSPRLDTNRMVTIPFAFRKSEETGRLKNFKVAGEVNAGTISTGSFCSNYGYDDSDVYKIIEGGAYSLATHPDPVLESFLDDLITDIASAQEPDGYLYTMRTINPGKSWAKERWVNARYNGSHELYNVGHMYEAAVAYFDATGKRVLLDVALKNADLLCNTFGPDKRPMASGHQEIEIGLAKLYRVTGENKYLDLAKFFLDERGKGEKSGSIYTQDHLPVTDQKEAVGHAVRATYMYSAMADVAALTGDSAYIRAIDRIWNDVVSGKIYLTGGIGSRSSGEAYGDRYELPNLTAYNETCAAIANVFWNYRMFLLHGDSRYIDVLERTLYNGVISGVSLDGTRFFYPNPLESEGNYTRSEWFGCSCCPSNISRFIPSIPGYIYATRADTLFVNLYIGNTGTIRIAGRELQVEQKTGYPWDGKVQLTLSAETPLLMTLALRIPGWAQNIVLPGGLYHFADSSKASPGLTLNGKLRQVNPRNGYVTITKTWKTGDVVELSIPMPVRKVLAVDQIDDDRNKVALTRGPIVYCAEGIDNDGDVKDLIVSLKTPFSYAFDPALLNGVGTLTGKINKLQGDGFSQPVVFHPSSLVLLPYYAWNHRGTGVMNVWFYDDRYVFAPLMDPPGSLFLNTITVRMKQHEGQEIYYTDGDDFPDQSTIKYEGNPVELSATTSLAAASFDQEGDASTIVLGNFSRVVLAPPLVVATTADGLICRYYEGRFRKLPRFDTLVPLKTVTVADIDAYTARDTADAYALEFDGLIIIPMDGIYTFFIRSDDGGRILIDGQQVAINDGLHEITEEMGQAALAKGLHRINVEFFDYGGDEGLEVLVAGPGLEKQRVPAEWFKYNEYK
ncbi:MAG: glycoside hydrolase family 127 protein [Bacteroidetes bacterium]|nr:MAG: glycoside hydrolase family 127 protein [Bacteroidota bacterium]